MIQPLYVFVIFCCKRNVYDAIMGIDKKKSIISSRAKGRSGTSNQMRMSNIKGGNRSSTGQSSIVDDQTALTIVSTIQS